METEQYEKVYPPVLTKKDFVRRYQKGEFGNRAPTWDSFDEWYWDTHNEVAHGTLFHIRNQVAGGPTYYNVPIRELERKWDALCKQVNPSSLYISAMAPTQKTMFQGEAQRVDGMLRLTYSTVVATMREALAKRTEYAESLAALGLCKGYMDHPSWEWLWVLLDRYPEHVIEFSVYSTCWGTIPNRNTVFWEVRKY